jgi:hypothetical protein
LHGIPPNSRAEYNTGNWIGTGVFFPPPTWHNEKSSPGVRLPFHKRPITTAQKPGLEAVKPWDRNACRKRLLITRVVSVRAVYAQHLINGGLRRSMPVPSCIHGLPAPAVFSRVQNLYKRDSIHL